MITNCEKFSKKNFGKIFFSKKIGKKWEKIFENDPHTIEKGFETWCFNDEIKAKNFETTPLDIHNFEKYKHD